MKFVVNVDAQGTAEWEVSCNNESYIISGEKKQLIFNIQKPGTYILHVTQEMSPIKISVFNKLLYGVISIIEVLFNIITFSWDNSWAEEVSPYCAQMAVKIEIEHDRNIFISIQESRYNKGLQNWNKPGISIRRVSQNNMCITYRFDENGFKEAFFHYKCKLVLLFLPALLLFLLVLFVSLCEKKYLFIIFSFILLVGLISTFIWKITKEVKKYKKLFSFSKDWFDKNLRSMQSED